MKSRYSDLERQIALERLVNNHYDISLTSIQTGISESTMLRWRRKYLPPTPPPFRGAPSLAISPSYPPLPANESLALQDIKRQLMDLVNDLSHSIKDAIPEAPLVQRSTALTQVIDRVVKISTLVPSDPQDDLLEDVEGEEPYGEAQHAQTSPASARNHQE